MNFLLWLLGLFALAVALIMAAHNPGFLLLVYPPYRIEMSLTMFVVLIVMLFVPGYFSIRILLSALRLPEYVRQLRARRAIEAGRSAMMEALGAFFEGRYAAAEQAAVRAMALGEQSAINPIIAARSAHEMRQFDKRDSYLAAAEGKSVGESTMRLIAQTKFSLDQHQPLAALKALKELQAAGVKSHIGAMHLELRAQQLAGNWDAVLDIMGQLQNRGAMDAVAAENIREQAWLEKIRASTSDASAVQAIWKSIPGDFRQRPKVAAAAARTLMQSGDCQTAAQILADRLNAQWDSDLVMLYGDCLQGESAEQLQQAERWLHHHPDDAGLLLTLGKLCLHQGLWSKAQCYLDASNSILPSSAAYNALGQLAEKLQHKEEASRNFHKAMNLTQSK